MEVETIETKSDQTFSSKDVPNVKANVSSGDSQGESLPGSARPKTGKICKHTWLGTKCSIQDCTKVHIDPCPDRECQVLDGGLPLYKTRNCQLWHVRPKSKLKYSKQTKKGLPVGGHWHPKQDQKKNLPLCLNQYHTEFPELDRYQRRSTRFMPQSALPKNSRPLNPWIQNATKPEHLISGNEPAAAAIKPHIRGGNQSPTWGLNSNQLQSQMIAEICQQVLWNLSNMNAESKRSLMF